MVIILLGVTVYYTHKLATREKYKKLRDTGIFPIQIGNVTGVPIQESSHKYDGHRYRQKRRYNFLSQRNNRSYGNL